MFAVLKNGEKFETKSKNNPVFLNLINYNK